MSDLIIHFEFGTLELWLDSISNQNLGAYNFPIASEKIIKAQFSMEDKTTFRSVEELSDQIQTDDPSTINTIDKCPSPETAVVIETAAQLQSNCHESSLKPDQERSKSPPHSWPRGNLRASPKWIRENSQSYQKIVSLSSVPVSKTGLCNIYLNTS